MTRLAQLARGHGLLVLTLALTALVYAPSLEGGWLGYDDDWLLRDNALLHQRGFATLAAILGNLSRETRLDLGAEFLPVRDLVSWIGLAYADASPQALRAFLLALYLGAIAALDRGLDGLTSPRRRAAIVALFALHPVHAESVAWLAGLKDVLSLGLLALALVTYRRDDARAWLTPVLVGLACLSKSTSVVAPLLLALTDPVVGRRPRSAILGTSLAIAVVIAGVQIHVGRTVGMFAPPLGGGGASLLASMLPVPFEYIGVSWLVVPLSVLRDVPVRSFAELTPWVSLAALVGAAGALYIVRSRAPRVVFGAAWFAIALLPVSQVLSPLQNPMADRYLVVALLGALVVAVELGGDVLARVMPTVEARRARAELVRSAAVLLVLAGLAWTTAERGMLFTDPILLFAEATERTTLSATAPYNLGGALEARGRLGEAADAYALALTRDRMRTNTGRRAGNNLARMLAQSGRGADALGLYRELHAHYPDDPRVLHNLATMEAAFGQPQQAAAYRAELASRFPTYAVDRLRPERGPH